MEARAMARTVRVTPRKARRLIDLIRGLPTGEAEAVLRFSPQSASKPIAKVLASAIANAENNNGLDPGTLWVSKAWVDEGPAFRRLRYRAQGRGHIIRKKTSHITVIVESRPDETPTTPRRGAARTSTRRRTR